MAWRTVSRALDADDAALLEALAGIVGSPAARLYLPDAEGSFAFAAEWNWPEVDGESGNLHLPSQAAAEGLVLADGELEIPAAWALLPLLHGDGIAGVALFARPRAACADADEALILAARQVGCHLAAQAAQAALAEAARFGDFHRSIAFATHDIKGVASQLALLAGNAERHGASPDFRADMVLTLRSATERLTTLLARLASGGELARPAPEGCDLGTLARAVAAAVATRHPVQVIEREPCATAGDARALEQVLTHLVQNGIEASPAESPVFIGISADGPWCRVEIIDSGHGMSAEFLRTRLFRPFDTAKPGGFGIGAYEARELVRGMGGQLQVESREGVGTRFVIRLPAAVAHSGRVVA
jgi:putative PEP-CTERM system histidine kinase